MSAQDNSEDRELTREAPSGIGGWLLLPLLGLIYSSVVILYQTVHGLLAGGFAPDTESEISRIVSYVFLAADYLIFAFGLFCLVRFLQRKKELLRLIFAYYGLCFTVLTVQCVVILGFPALSPFEPQVFFRASIGLLLSLIWPAYFERSVRVKRTFTR